MMPQWSVVPRNILRSAQLSSVPHLLPRSPLAGPRRTRLTGHADSGRNFVTRTEARSPVQGSPPSASPLQVVLDLNGTLLNFTRDLGTLDSFHALQRRKNIRKPVRWITPEWGTFAVHFRPGLDDFLDWLFEESGFRVGCWTFSTAEEVERTLELGEIAFGRHSERLEFIFNRSHSPGQSKIKDLEVIWDQFPGWTEQTTVLIDDSDIKVLKQPANALTLTPCSVHYDDPMNELLLVRRTLERLSERDIPVSPEHPAQDMLKAERAKIPTALLSQAKLQQRFFPRMFSGLDSFQKA